MKALDELRKDFEEIIDLDLNEFEYDQVENLYSPHTRYDGFERIEKLHNVCTINGAWWMFQELNK